MITLGRHRNYRNVKGNKNQKPFDSSLSNFQDFLEQSQTKPHRSKSKNFSTQKVKMERLNFSNTASGSFLPPKSLDKYRLSSTNRQLFTMKEQFFKIETQNPKQPSDFIVQGTQDYQITNRQIKAKVESNAMQRFQQLFKKQTNLRAKKIEQQQSKRLLCLLQNTSRKNRQNKQNQVENKTVQPYFSGLATRSKYVEPQTMERSKNERENEGKSQNLMFNLQRRSIDSQMMLKKTIQENKLSLQQERKTNNKENKKVVKEISKTIEQKTDERKSQNFEIKRKNSFVKQKTTIEQSNREKQQLNKGKQQPKREKQQSNKGRQGTSIQQLLIQENNKYITQVNERKETQQTVNRPVINKKIQQATTKNKNEQKQTMQLKPQSRNSHQLTMKNYIESSKTSEIKQNNIKVPLLKQERKSIQIAKKNSFEPNNFQIEELPTVSMNNKNTNNKEKPIQQKEIPITNKPESIKKVDQTSNKPQIDISLLKLQQLSFIPQEKNPKPPQTNSSRNSITIKTSKDIKPSIKDKQTPKVDRYSRQEDIEELDVVQIGGGTQRSTNFQKSISSTKKIEQNINVVKQSSKSIQSQQSKNKPQSKSVTSILQQATSKDLQQTKKSSGVGVGKKSQINIAENLPQKQQFQEPDLHPADELDYLICLVQNLGRYHNKSKQFYSSTESSMVEIVMNHKLAAYYVSQQFFYYLNFFIQQFDKEPRTQFFSLSSQDLQQALSDESIQQAVDDLRKSCQVARKLIKHTFQKCKMYLKRDQKQLKIESNANFHSKCLQYILNQFRSLYKLYEERKTKTLAERLCFLIEIYCILNSLNGESAKEFEDLDDIGEDRYHEHINQYKNLLK